ncbi:hypothetical protein ACRWOO_16355 [Streptomyces sp. NEAU-PBA10]|uniref:Uncharacterized protein n=2 Tax=Streptomyces TaxID=1883 RepID=A0ABP7GH86_9ACTN|nr:MULTISPECIES: hypothetical protein [Streptomyces]MBZ3908582.1 hypothetical protein [Streptomyces griseiscabiei]MDX2916037.1 hypothetical protein [Streptomyces griseiscabiei]
MSLALIAVLALGYAVGRLRPWARFGLWVEDLTLPRNHRRWIASRWREWALFAALAVTRPAAAYEVWLGARAEKRTRRQRH